LTPVISFVGKHNSGKTTLLTRVIEVLVKKNIKTAVIKHAASELDINSANDSDRLFNAGASRVYASSPGKTLEYSRSSAEMDLKDICNRVSNGVDLVLTEGFKKEPYPKIEVLRSAISKKTMDLNNVVARVADFNLGENDSKQVFQFNQHDEIAEFIIDLFNLNDKRL